MSATRETSAVGAVVLVELGAEIGTLSRSRLLLLLHLPARAENGDQPAHARAVKRPHPGVAARVAARGAPSRAEATCLPLRYLRCGACGRAVLRRSAA